MENELAVIKYSVTDAVIADLKAKYTGLKIVDSASYETVRLGIAECRDWRVGLEKERKKWKANFLAEERKGDARAKEITALIEEVENPLKAEKNRVDGEKERIRLEKAAKELDRVAAIRARIFAMQQLVSNFLGKTAPELQAISERLFDTEITRETFQEFTDEAERVKMECLDISLKAREVRIKWEAEEAARKVEAERLEKQRKEQEAEAKRLTDEKAKLEAEKKAEQAKRDREDFERNAKDKAEKEAREKVEREQKEKQEKEEAEAKELERKAALAPDKEKLLNYANQLETIKIARPIFSSDIANTILGDAMKALRGIVAMIRKEAEKL